MAYGVTVSSCAPCLAPVGFRSAHPTTPAPTREVFIQLPVCYGDTICRDTRGRPPAPVLWLGVLGEWLPG